MADVRRMQDADFAGKRVLVRVDFNVPLTDGPDGQKVVADASRIEAAMPTIQALRTQGAKVVLISHLGRPKGQHDPAASLAPIQKTLGEMLNTPVLFAEDCIGEQAKKIVMGLPSGGVALLENLRFHPGEEKNDPDFARALAENGDAFVNDGFSVSHRAHASTEGIARLLPSYAGLAMQRELDHLSQVLESPRRPLVAVVGGAKVSTKIDVLKSLAAKADTLVIGGAMANTFLHAQGVDVGGSLAERDDETQGVVREILSIAENAGHTVLLPVDVVVAKKFERNAEHRNVTLDAVQKDDLILDAGNATVDAVADVFEQAATLLWNGPLGAFETPPFDTATVETAQFAARMVRGETLVAVAGGGDTVAALRHAGVYDDFTYVSNAGGAFLEWVEGRALPGVEALKA